MAARYRIANDATAFAFYRLCCYVVVLSTNTTEKTHQFMDGRNVSWVNVQYRYMKKKKIHVRYILVLDDRSLYIVNSRTSFYITEYRYYKIIHR